MYKAFSIQFIVLFFALTSFGQEISIKLKDDFHNSFKIDYELYVLKDTTASLSFEDAQESIQFKLHQQSIAPNLGFTSNNYWFKFIITNTQAKQSLCIGICLSIF